ncbi:MAG: DUF4339 domain-containing protein [Treponema sp.]|nr:DUF4339 domain-containing protein [Treponema sp.]
MLKKILFFTIYIFLIMGNSGIVVAQTASDTDIQGYFVNINGYPTGPFTVYGLRELIKRGYLSKDTMVWKKEMPVWVLAGDLNELSLLLASSPPPAAPPLTMVPDRAPPPVPQPAPKPMPEPEPVTYEQPSFPKPEPEPVTYEQPSFPEPEPEPVTYEQPSFPLSEPEPVQNIPVSFYLPYEDEYEDFSAGQRWAAFSLNFIVPGLGSFAVMRDATGGFVNLGLGLAAYAAGAVGTLMILDQRDFGYGLIAAGAALYAGALIQNIVWSSSYHRPKPKIALMDLGAWNIAVLPGKSGIEAVALSCTMRF